LFDGAWRAAVSDEISAELAVARAAKWHVIAENFDFPAFSSITVSRHGIYEDGLLTRSPTPPNSRRAAHPWCWAGDYNVVPTPQDIYPTRSLDDNALIQPESQEAFARLLAQGWTDAMRKLHPDGQLWTFWDYKFERWQKDKGMRLDHFLLSPNLSDRLVDGGVDRWARGQENASDHAPTWITLDP